MCDIKYANKIFYDFMWAHRKRIMFALPNHCDFLMISIGTDTHLMRRRYDIDERTDDMYKMTTTMRK